MDKHRHQQRWRNDTLLSWTAAGIVVSDKVNSKRFVVPDATHSTARVKHMDAGMQKEYSDKVKALAGLDVHVEAVQ